jgi:anti-sigma B factor antagonist
MPLTIADREQNGHHVLAIAGDLDLVTAPQLAEAASALVEAGARDLVVDAAHLDFCDSSGLTAFVRIARQLEPSGRLAIAGAQPIVRRILEVSGLVEAFVVADSVDDALAALPAE